MPLDGGGSTANPEGRTPMGIPTKATESDPTADSTRDRFKTEVAALNVELATRPANIDA